VENDDVILTSSESSRVMMVTTEYPPMQGGVGRYSANLVTSLRKLGLDVLVVCNEKGNGDFYGLSPSNSQNSEVLLNAVTELKPDIVHIQYEHGLYGLMLDLINPTKISTNIDSFYSRCNVPIVTTFHSAYNFKQWINLAAATTTTKNKHKINRYISYAFNLWKRLLNYHSFNGLNQEKLAMSKAGIVFSQYLANLISGDSIRVGSGNIDAASHHRCEVIYHGAEPSSKITTTSRHSKIDARNRFSLPEGPRIALALGYRTATKGWDIFENMKIPDGWIVVTNSAENHYNKEVAKNMTLKFNKQTPNLVDLQKDFMTDEDLSFLFYAADATILPYKVCSGSGVMFDGLAHGLPFVASDLGFFREFSSKGLGLGITVKRDPAAFAYALKALDKDYEEYSQRVKHFKEKLKWDIVAAQHAALYRRIIMNADIGKPLISAR
jgi:glycosyltransferase involved in cell wall biosynthesis